MAAPKQRLGFWYRVVANFLRPILMVTTRRAWSGTEHLPPAGIGVVVAPQPHLIRGSADTRPLPLGQRAGSRGTSPRKACSGFPYWARSSPPGTDSGVSRVPRCRPGLPRCRLGGASGRMRGHLPGRNHHPDPDLWPMIGKTGAARSLGDRLRGDPDRPVGTAGNPPAVLQAVAPAAAEDRPCAGRPAVDLTTSAVGR